MFATDPCPEPERLRNYLSVPPHHEGIQPLERHLERCADCAERLSQFLAEDDLLIAVKAQGITPIPVANELQRLQQQLLGWCLSAQHTPNPQTHDTARNSDAPDWEVNLSHFLSPPQSTDELGRLSHYRVLQVLGRGGMGIVFRAEDTELQRVVAIKMMLAGFAAEARQRERFRREAQALASLDHDHIIRVFHVDEDRGLPFLTMEYLEGQSLDVWLQNNPQPSLGEIGRIGREIAEGLAAAHERGVIHRDIKPSNIFLAGPQRRVKLLDFGLARATEGQKITKTGALMGTPAYMAPEQAEAGAVDHRADLFSLGCVLYEMCSNQLPFPGTTPMQILASMLNTEPKPLHHHHPRISVPMSRLVAQLLEKDRNKRPATTRTVVEELERIEEDRRKEPTAVMKAELPPPRFRKQSRRWQGSIAALFGFIALLGGSLAVALWMPSTTTLSSDSGGGGLGLGEEEKNATPTIPANPEVIKDKQFHPQSTISSPTSIDGVLSWCIVTRASKGSIIRMAFDPANSRLAIHSADGLIRILDPQTREVKLILVGASLPAKDAGPSELAFSPDGKYLLTGYAGEIWELATGRLVQRIPKFWRGNWTPDGQGVIYHIMNDNEEIHRWDAKTATSKKRFDKVGNIVSLAIHPDGKRVATNKGGGTIYDLETGKLDIELEKPGENTTTQAVSWSPDGKRFAAFAEVTRIGYRARVYEGDKYVDCDIGNTFDVMHWTPRGELCCLERAASLVTAVRLRRADDPSKVALEIPYVLTGQLTADAWDPKGDVIVLGTSTGQVQCINRKGKVVWDLPGYDPKRNGTFLVNQEGHYRSSTTGIEKEMRYIVLTKDKEQKMYTPEEFNKEYKWKNDPTKVKIP